MEGVEHLGKYVWEMTRAKVESLKRGGLPERVLVAAAEQDGGGVVEGEDEDVPDRPEEVLLREDEDEDVGPEEPEEVPV
jgi:intron-binding protein aquarius